LKNKSISSDSEAETPRKRLRLMGKPKEKEEEVEQGPESSEGHAPESLLNRIQPRDGDIESDARRENSVRDSSSNNRRPHSPSKELTVYMMTKGDQFDVLDAGGRWCEAEVQLLIFFLPFVFFLNFLFLV
jgi:hypothetical protein